MIREMRRIGHDKLRALIRRAAAFTTIPPHHAATAAEAIIRRRKVMGEKLYVFYDPPLHIVKGEGVWLSASDGRRYLDCYNNVPHVGHAHPYVAEAIARQARTLNTNTRYITDQAIEYAERLTALAADQTGSTATVAAVEFYVDGTEIGSVTTPPYTTTWTPLWKRDLKMWARRWKLDILSPLAEASWLPMPRVTMLSSWAKT